ncbi:MAG: PQQ-dependent sugar dehydrogenase [Thermoleophilaceae bacterium]|nr:PQQ-dependent sugar dehydrogenase [Thermoleophilaceae bacterium]
MIALLALAAVAPGALSHPFHPGAEVADTSARGLALQRMGTFAFPVYVTSPRGDTARQFVVEQSGQIRIIKNGRTLRRPFLNISSIVEFDEGERGLLSMAFAPDYATSRRFYVFFTQRGSGDLRVEEFRRSAGNPDVALRSSRRRVLEIEHSAHANHNGGQLQFGAGGLYVSTGDGGGGGDPLRSGQDRDSLLGKVLRIDPRRPTSTRGYSIPSSNPFVGRSGRDEIWHYGLRNPWRFSFDRANGNMSIGDVGQGAMEEVDFVSQSRRGVNFGWNCFEGTRRYSAGCSAPGHRPPVLEYTHDGGASCSVTGGYIVRDRAVPRLYGRYLYGDYCTGALHAATLRAEGATSNASLSLVVPRLTSFGEDAQGRLYMTSRSYGGRRGAVYRLRAAP